MLVFVALLRFLRLLGARPFPLARHPHSLLHACHLSTLENASNVGNCRPPCETAPSSILMEYSKNTSHVEKYGGSTSIPALLRRSRIAHQKNNRRNVINCNHFPAQPLTSTLKTARHSPLCSARQHVKVTQNRPANPLRTPPPAHPCNYLSRAVTVHRPPLYPFSLFLYPYAIPRTYTWNPGCDPMPHEESLTPARNLRP